MNIMEVLGLREPAHDTENCPCCAERRSPEEGRRVLTMRDEMSMRQLWTSVVQIAAHSDERGNVATDSIDMAVAAADAVVAAYRRQFGIVDV